MGSLKMLTVLQLNLNSLSGAIPCALGNLKKLNELRLDSNVLNGSIPACMRNLTALQVLNLRSNNLSGPVPRWIGELPSLHNLSLSFNRLSGPLPVSIGNLSSLQYLWLNSNQLNGRIPSSLSRLWSLSELDLSINNFTGPLPDLSHLNNLTTCSIKDNAGICHNLDFQAKRDTCGYLLTPECRATDCQVLSGWIRLDSASCCSDPRVDCNGLGRVTGLYLRLSNISGEIPVRISYLDQLILLFVNL